MLAAIGFSVGNAAKLASKNSESKTGIFRHFKFFFIFREARVHRVTFCQGHGPVSVRDSHLFNQFTLSPMFQNNQVEQKELQHCTGCLTSLNEGQFVNVCVT